MARKRTPDNPMAPEVCWVWYQINLRNIKLEMIAKKARCSIPNVSRVISGIRRAENVRKVLAEMLGFSSYEDLMEAAHQQSKEGAA